MTPKWQKLASLAKEICKLWFQFFGAVLNSKGYPFKNILNNAIGIKIFEKYFTNSIADIYFGFENFCNRAYQSYCFMAICLYF